MEQNVGNSALQCLPNGEDYAIEFHLFSLLAHQHLIQFDKAAIHIYNVNMSLTFDWDKEKSISNRKKHGITFEEAQTVFLDETALMIHDPDHSEDEDRFIILGLSVKLKILVVCHCYRKSNEVIRIISVRKATRTEQKRYWER